MWLIRSAIAAMFPGTGDVPGAADLDLDDFLRRYRSEAPPLMWIGLWLGAIAFAVTPLVTVGWPLPAFLLPRKVLDTHAYRVATHRWYLLRQLVAVVKMTGGLAWGQHPRIRALHAVTPYRADPGTWRVG